MKSRLPWTALFVGLLIAAGCGDKAPAPTAKTPAAATGHAAGGSELLLAAEPADARGVIELREKAKDGDQVVVVGKVGGSREPCVKGRAAFTIVDMSYQSCDERGESCDTPWDYCHAPQEQIAKASAMVKLVDGDGKTLAKDVQDSFGIRPLQVVVVQGRAKRDENGNFSVLGEHYFIRPKAK